ncbi:zinc finger CCCH domain-containing protein 28-like protein [Carex littledalei]|uniref:Zinc finger CCCH domain-containing protein 28-like protein n=1 Tax=Carex littledalei TaxID=544730 RepID=A0A833VQS3_9POAL|nr:zinc finger CCCH domain-containing protein 28-like protein [Carex littledalei]
MASYEPPPPPEANPNPREGFSFVHKRPRLCQFTTVPVCPDFLRRVCGLSPSQCMFAHPPPSVTVERDKVTVCYAYLRNTCHHGLACCYFHPPPHIREALLKEMGTDYQRPEDVSMSISYIHFLSIFYQGFLQRKWSRSKHHSKRTFSFPYLQKVDQSFTNSKLGSSALKDVEESIFIVQEEVYISYFILVPMFPNKLFTFFYLKL